jgi:hypothetical protein
MMELIILALLTTLWLHPRWANLNKGGIFLVLLMAPSMVLVWWLLPSWSRTLLVWWGVYLALFLAVGGAIVLSRIGASAAFAAESREAAPGWAPVIGRAGIQWVKRLAPFAALGVGVLAVSTVLSHASFDGFLFLAAVIALGPLAAVGYFWFAANVADVLAK